MSNGFVVSEKLDCDEMGLIEIGNLKKLISNSIMYDILV